MPTPAVDRETQRLLLVGGLAGIAGGVASMQTGAGGLAVAVAVAAIGLVLGAALLRPSILLLAFIALLPVHVALLLLLFNGHVDHSAIRVFSLWKEVAALAFLGILVVRQAVRGKVPVLRLLDAVVLAFLLLNMLYMLVPAMSPFHVPFAARAQGFRDNTFFVILYFIGRLAPLTLAELRVLCTATITVGILGIVVGVYERVFIPIDFFFSPLRLDDFMRDYLNIHFHTGIPYNFWTSTGTIRRGVSFYLGSQHFAMASLLLFPLALAARRPLRTFPHSLRVPLLACLTLGLMLPLTRSVMLACLLQVIVVGWVTRRPHYVLVAVLTVVLLLGITTAFFDLSGYARTVVSSPESSLWDHVRSWEGTLSIVGDFPFGVGFGIFDTAAERAAGGQAGVLGGEGEYAFTVTSIGLPGLLLFLVLQVAVVTMLLTTYRRASSPGMQQLALVTLAMFVGTIVVGAFTQVRHVPAILFPVWWLVGAVARGSLEGEDARPLPAAPLIHSTTSR